MSTSAKLIQEYELSAAQVWFMTVKTHSAFAWTFRSSAGMWKDLCRVCVNMVCSHMQFVSALSVLYVSISTGSVEEGAFR